MKPTLTIDGALIMLKHKSTISPLALMKGALLMAAVALTACSTTPDTLDQRKAKVAKSGVSNVVVTDELPQVTLNDILMNDVVVDIKSGDLISIKIFGFEDLSGEHFVGRFGDVNLPLVGKLRVAGMSPLDLQETLTREYGGEYLQDPSIVVQVEPRALGEIVVDGAVDSPNVFEINGVTPLSKAIAMAGGTHEDAFTKEVFIIRSLNGKRYIKTANLEAIRTLGEEDPVLVPNDTVIVQYDQQRLMMDDLIQIVPLLSLGAVLATR